MSFGIQSEQKAAYEKGADQHDAALIMDLFNILHSPQMTADWTWFVTKFNVKTWATVQKKFPADSDEWASLERLLDFWQMVAALVRHKVLNKELLFDAMPQPVEVWSRVEGWLADARKTFGGHRWADIEMLGQQATVYYDEN